MLGRPPPYAPPSAAHKTCGGMPRENSVLTVNSQSTATSSGSRSSGGISVGAGVDNRTCAPPLVVRRTFIDYPVERTPSLEEFLQERQVHSEPSKKEDSTSGYCGSEVHMIQSPPTRESVAIPTLVAHAGPAGGYSQAVAVIKEDEEEEASSDEDEGLRDMPDAIAQGLTLGTPEYPSLGSGGHLARRCKPCAFVMKGCNSGVNCPFCHLCAPGEKKRRRKERMSTRKGGSSSVTNRLRSSLSSGINGFFS